MSNQMLAGIAMLLATVLIIKSGKKKYFLVTALPLLFLLCITTTAVFQKVFSTDVKIGFFAMAKSWQNKIDSSMISSDQISVAQNLIFNQKLVGYIALSFAVILWVVVFEGIRRSLPYFLGKSPALNA